MEAADAPTLEAGDDVDAAEPAETGENSWTAPYADEDSPAANGAFETDGPGGRRLKTGWRRCSDEEGDVVSSADAPSCPPRSLRAAPYPFTPSRPPLIAVVRE